ncbi:MAG: motility associated factor glycosyltransferase family protein [bacterium]|nr:motility associated factor glycosyltransferase family protein [bacterium]
MKPGEIPYEIVPTKEEFPTLVVNLDGREVPLHSKFRPSRESETLKDNFLPEKYDLLIVLGTGLGYHLAPLEEKIHEYSRIILVDILGGIEEHIQKNKKTGFLADSKKTAFVCGNELSLIEKKLSELIDMESAAGISVLEHPASVRLFGEYYNEVKNSIQKIINNKAGNTATKKAFGSLYLRNIIKNLGSVKNFKPINKLFNRFSEHPAIIIASGPSLEESIGLLKENSNKFFIIAVDSALPVLYQHAISPDIVLSIDPQPYIFEHFREALSSGTIPVFSLSASPLVVQKYKGFLSLNSHPLSQILLELYPGAVGSIDSGTGSVAGDALFLAQKLGFSSIGILGLDFSFNNYIIYAKGTAYQKRYSQYFQDRFSPVEKLNFNYIMKSSKGFKHSGKFTRKSFIRYKETLENFTREHAANLYNINSMGIEIETVSRLSFTEFISTQCGGPIDKSSIKSSILLNTKDLDSIISTKQLKELLSDKNLFNKLMEASLGNMGNNQKTGKFISLIKNLE